LAQRSIAYLRSDDVGAVTVRLTRDGYEVKTFLK
jgi:hypothetical protein